MFLGEATVADKWFNNTFVSYYCIGYTANYRMTKHTMSHNSQRTTSNKEEYGDILCCNISGKYFYMYNTFQTRYICVHSGTQQSYVLALDGGIEKDNYKHYLHLVIVLGH